MNAPVTHLPMLPHKRAQCEGEPDRACPMISCRHHLFWETPLGRNIRIKRRRRGPLPDLDTLAEQVADTIESMSFTCVLDVVDVSNADAVLRFGAEPEAT